MPAQLGIQIWIRNSKVNFKLSKTEVLDIVSSYIKEVRLEWDTLKNLTASWFLKDLISTFALTLWVFSGNLYSGQNQANTGTSVLKLKHPLRNTCSGRKNLSYPTPIVLNRLPTDLELTNSLNNFKHKLKNHFLKENGTRCLCLLTPY